MADPNFRLKKGTFIDQQVGFVDAFNYVYENINGIDGGQGIELDKTIDGAWQINADQSTDGGSGGGGGDYGKVVEDVTEDTQDDKDGLKIWYTDGNDTFIPFPSLSGGGGEVQFTGTDASSTILSSSFTLSKEDNTNITIKCDGTDIKFGVYYI